jgi:hypothetical protein
MRDTTGHNTWGLADIIREEKEMKGKKVLVEETKFELGSGWDVR